MYIIAATILPWVCGILGIITPIYISFHQGDNQVRYFNELRQKGFLLSPSIGLFVFLWMFWISILPLFGLNANDVALLIGCIYLYIVLLYSVVDDRSTFGVSLYFTYNLCIVCQTYSKNPSVDMMFASFGCLLLFTTFTVFIIMNTSTIQQHLKWFIWYSATISGLCRWRIHS